MKLKRSSIIIFMLPAVLLYCGIFLYPTLRTFIMSFCNVPSLTAASSEWSFVGMQNYKDMLSTPLFRQSLMNLFGIWLIGGIGVMIFSLLFAEILSNGIYFKRFFRSVIYLPNVISAVALGTMWLQYAFNPNWGLFHSFFDFLGWESMAGFQWTAPQNMFLSLIIAYDFGLVGYFMLMFLAAIERIPTDCFEAATIEGAGAFKQFFYIKLPLLKGMLQTSFVLWSVRCIGFFVWSKIFAPITPTPETITPMVYMYQLTFVSDVNTPLNVGGGAAIGVILTILVLLMFLLSKILFKTEDYSF